MVAILSLTACDLQAYGNLAVLEKLFSNLKLILLF